MSLGKPTQTSIFTSQFQSPTVVIAVRVFPIKDIDLPETLMLLMGRFLERVGSVTTATAPVISVFTS